MQVLAVAYLGQTRDVVAVALVVGTHSLHRVVVSPT